MNILILSWRSPGHPNAGGAEQVTLEHAKAWVNAGHQVVWFSSEFEGGKIQENIGGVIVIRRGDYVLGVRWHALMWYFLGKHPNFDLVVDEFHGIPFFTPFYVRGRKLGFIHEVAKDVWRLNPWPKPFNFIPAIIGTIFEPHIFKFFYKKIPFMTVSESTKEDLIKWHIPRRGIVVVSNGVKLHKPKGELVKASVKTAMYLGALSEDKGTFDAIKAFGEIERKDDGWQYWLAGYGTKEYVERLKSTANQVGVLEKLKYWGYVNDQKKFELLAKAHILINPSVHEGWGLVNIEANSVGTPVVGYDVHGIRDSVRSGKTGILVKKGDFRALAEETIKLYRENHRYERLKNNAINWSKKFTWEKATKESLELIESL